jgi:hypothetical protein
MQSEYLFMLIVPKFDIGEEMAFSLYLTKQLRLCY